MKINTILLLAGGDSTRFWPLTRKNYLPFLGKPLIAHQIAALSPFTDHIIVVVNPNDLDVVPKGVEMVVQKNVEDGQAGAVLSAKDFIKGSTLILNANDVFDFSAIEKLLTADKQFAFLAKKVTQYFPGGYVKFDNEKIVGIVEKPGAGNEPSDITKLVADYFKDGKLLISAIEQSKVQNDDWYEQSLSKIIADGASTSYIPYEGEWVTIKYPWQVLVMMRHFLNTIPDKQIGKNIQISDRAIISGAVVIGDNVKIGDHTKIVGPCYIGDGTIIGDYAMVRESHIGNNCLIGGYSEVTRSYLGNNVMLHRDYVGDSVFGNNVLMGADAVTANYRFDGKEVATSSLKKLGAIIGNGAKIGVHSTLTPGVKVGANTFVGPHTLIDEDLKENIFLYKGVKKENTYGNTNK